jgi:hypothetical protein
MLLLIQPQMTPLPYEYGSKGPEEAAKLIEKYNFKDA